MKSDIEIAQSVQPLPIGEVARPADWEKAKVDLALLRESSRSDGKLIFGYGNTADACRGKETHYDDRPFRWPAPAGKKRDCRLAGTFPGPVSALREARPSAAGPRGFPWRKSICILLEIFMPWALPTTCWRPCWTSYLSGK